MNRSTTWILIGIAILLVIAVLLITGTGKDTFRSSVKDFAVSDTSTITRVFLADKKNRTILLERQTNGSWLVNNTHKVRPTAINLLFETLKNLKTKYPVPKNAYNAVIAQLAAQSVKVEIYQQIYRIDIFGKIRLFRHEKRTKTFYVGGATQDNMGNFMIMEDADQPFVVHLLGFRGFIAPRFSTMEKDWRDHGVFRTRLYDIREVIMQVPSNPSESYKVLNRDDQIELIALETNEVQPGFDTLKMLNFLTGFTDLRYEALIEDMNPARQDSIIHSLPQYILTVVDVAGDTTSVKTFFKENDQQAVDMEGNLYVYDVDRLFGLINDDRDFVLMQYFVFDRVLRPLSFFKPGN